MSVGTAQHFQKHAAAVESVASIYVRSFKYKFTLHVDVYVTDAGSKCQPESLQDAVLRGAKSKHILQYIESSITSR